MARALVTGPRVVFADEPTGALDSLAGEQLMDELTRTARADGITLVIVTHDNRVAAYADRELVSRDGELAAEVAA
jgi:putative ABC transport system ATP-binding protein